MDREKLKEFLLKKFPEAKVVSGGKEVNIKCRLCGDSRKGSHYHFYISLGNEVEPPMYKCFHCNAGGLLTVSFLSQLLNFDIIDSDIAYELNEEIKNKVKYSLYRKPNKFINNLIYHYPIIDNDINREKLNYISERIGYNFTYNDLMENKIILNLGDLLYYNNIIQYTRDKDIMQKLNDFFIGFLSLDNGYVTLRKYINYDIYPDKINTRYVNYNIFNSISGTMRYYCIPTQCNLLSNEPIHIRIGEGCFDILSILYNLNNNNRYNNIYIASNGKGYYNVIKVLLDNFNLINIIIHLYPDNDVSQYELQYFIDKIKNIGINVYIHRNSYPGEKDFGVPINKIQESVYKV